MTYVPPYGDAVTFAFSGQDYTPPYGDNLVLNFQAGSGSFEEIRGFGDLSLSRSITITASGKIANVFGPVYFTESTDGRFFVTASGRVQPAGRAEVAALTFGMAPFSTSIPATYLLAKGLVGTGLNGIADLAAGLKFTTLGVVGRSASIDVVVVPQVQVSAFTYAPVETIPAVTGTAMLAPPVTFSVTGGIRTSAVVSFVAPLSVHGSGGSVIAGAASVSDALHVLGVGTIQQIGAASFHVPLEVRADDASVQRGVCAMNASATCVAAGKRGVAATGRVVVRPAITVAAVHGRVATATARFNCAVSAAAVRGVRAAAAAISAPLTVNAAGAARQIVSGQVGITLVPWCRASGPRKTHYSLFVRSQTTGITVRL